MTQPLPLHVVVLAAVFLWRAFAPAASGLLDVDYYWHLRYGQDILATHHLPTVDLWSWTAHGQPYRLTQWLGEVCMALADSWAGPTGTRVLSAALATGTIGATYAAVATFVPNRLIALCLALLADAVTLALPCRPHQFTHLALATLAYGIVRWEHTRSIQTLAWIPVLFAVWVNLHGGYVIGLVFLAVVIAAQAAEAYVTHSQPVGRVLLSPLALCAVLSLLATLLNPYGIGAWQYVVEVATLKSTSMGIVDEWAPTSLASEPGVAFFVTSALAITALIGSSKRVSIADLLLTLFAITLGLVALRLSILASILLAPLIARYAVHTPLYTLTCPTADRRFDGLSLGPALLLVALAGTVSAGLAARSTEAQRLEDQRFPKQIVQFMRDSGIQGRLLNPPEIGGFLLARQSLPVFLDTRLDLYGDQLLFDYLLARRGAPVWTEVIDKYSPDLIIIDHTAPLRQLLLASGQFRSILEDASFSLMVRRAPDYDHFPTAPALTTDPSRKIQEWLLAH
jgi:hypothetical protein